MSSKKISIIVPVYNVEKYLEDCIASVISQKNFSEIELILINDGSTDDSYKIIEKYVEQYENIQTYYQPNSGLSAARNKGMELATGEYIYFLDSDDMITENAMDYLYSLAVTERLDLILFEASSFYDETASNKTFKEGLNYTRRHNYPGILKGEDLFAKLVLNQDFYDSACLQFIKKKSLVASNITFLEGAIHEDELFSPQILLSCDRVKCIEDKLFLRRIRSNSIMTTLNYEKRIESLIKIAEQTIKFNGTLNSTNSDLQKALNIRMNHLLGQSISYLVESKDSIRKKFYKPLKKLKNEIKQKNYSVYKKYEFFFVAPRVYKLLKKVH